MTETITKQLNNTNKKVEDLAIASAGQKFKKIITIPKVLETPFSEDITITDALIRALIDIGGEGWKSGSVDVDPVKANASGTNLFTYIDVSKVLGSNLKEWYMFEILTEEIWKLVTLQYTQKENMSSKNNRDTKIIRVTESGFEEVPREVNAVGGGKLEIGLYPREAGVYLLGMYSDTFEYSLTEKIGYSGPKFLDIRALSTKTTHFAYSKVLPPEMNPPYVKYGFKGVYLSQKKEVTSEGFLCSGTIDRHGDQNIGHPIIEDPKMTKSIFSVPFRESMFGVDMYEATPLAISSGYVFPALDYIKYIILADPSIDLSKLTYTEYPSVEEKPLTSFNEVTPNSTSISFDKTVDISKIKVFGYSGEPNFESDLIPISGRNFKYKHSGMYEYFSSLDTPTKKGKEFLVTQFECNRLAIMSKVKPEVAIDGVSIVLTQIRTNALTTIWEIPRQPINTCIKLISNIDIMVMSIPRALKYIAPTAAAPVGSSFAASKHALFMPSIDGTHAGTEFHLFNYLPSDNSGEIVNGLESARQNVYISTFGNPDRKDNINKITIYNPTTGVVAKVYSIAGDSCFLINTFIPANSEFLRVTSEHPIVISSSNKDNNGLITNPGVTAMQGHLAGITEVATISPEYYNIPTDRMSKDYIELSNEYIGSPLTAEMGAVPLVDGKLVDKMTSDYDNYINIEHNGFLYVNTVKIVGDPKFNPYTLSLKNDGVVVKTAQVNVLDGTVMSVKFEHTVISPGAVIVESDKPLALGKVADGPKTYTDDSITHYPEATGPMGRYGVIYEVITDDGSGWVDPDRLAGITEDNSWRLFTSSPGYLDKGMQRTVREIIWNLKYEPLAFSKFTLLPTTTPLESYSIQGYDLDNHTWVPLTDDKKYGTITNTKPFLIYRLMLRPFEMKATKVSMGTWFTLADQTIAESYVYKPAISVYGWTEVSSNNENAWTYIMDTESTLTKTGSLTWNELRLRESGTNIKCYLEFSQNKTSWTPRIEYIKGSYITAEAFSYNRYVRVTLKIIDNIDPLGSNEAIWFRDVKLDFRDVIM